MNMLQIPSRHARSRSMRCGYCECTVCQFQPSAVYSELLCWPSCFIATRLGPAFAVLPPEIEETRLSAAASTVSTVLNVFHQSQNYLPTQTINCSSECRAMQSIRCMKCFLHSTTIITAICRRVHTITNFPKMEIHFSIQVLYTEAY